MKKGKLTPACILDYKPDDGLLFYLGTHEPSWLSKTSVPLFLSRRRLIRQQTRDKARGRWALDSGGFQELTLNGKWTVTALQYVSEVRVWSQEIGKPDFAASQDWMCEPFVIKKTGKTVREHQQRSVDSYLELRDLAPEINWIPVVQGYTISEYMECVHLYSQSGVDLTRCSLVGVGSVCRRQATTEVQRIFQYLHGVGLKLHGFGVKRGGIEKSQKFMKSCDSMAWSKGARMKPPTCGGSHKNCGNCIKYALHWREDLLKGMR